MDNSHAETGIRSTIQPLREIVDTPKNISTIASCDVKAVDIHVDKCFGRLAHAQYPQLQLLVVHGRDVFRGAPQFLQFLDLFPSFFLVFLAIMSV